MLLGIWETAHKAAIWHVEEVGGSAWELLVLVVDVSARACWMEW